MNILASLRIHAFIKAITPDGDWSEITLKFDHRHDIQGECSFTIWTSDSHGYCVGQELCCIPGLCGPPGCLRIQAHIEKISDPFDDIKFVELKIQLDPRDDINGACRWRICPIDAAEYSVGDEIRFVVIPFGPHL